MPHFMIVLIPYINLLNLFLINNCLLLKNMEPLKEMSVFEMYISALNGLNPKRAAFIEYYLCFFFIIIYLFQRKSQSVHEFRQPPPSALSVL